MLIGMLEPSWWGPQWLTDLRAAGVDIHADPDAEEEDHTEWRSAEVNFLSGSAEPSVVGARLMKYVSFGAKPMAQWPATEVCKADGSGEKGRLRRYDEGLAFVSDKRVQLADDDPATKYAVVMPFREIKKLDLVYKVNMRRTGDEDHRPVELDQPMLRIGLDDEVAWMFDLPRAPSVAREIAELAGRPVCEIR